MGWHPEPSCFPLAESDSPGGCGLLHTSRKVSGPSRTGDAWSWATNWGEGGGCFPGIAPAAPTHTKQVFHASP